MIFLYRTVATISFLLGVADFQENETRWFLIAIFFTLGAIFEKLDNAKKD